MVAEWKIKEVETLAKKISDSKVIGLVNISGIPSKQFQNMRKNLRDKLQIQVCKNSITQRAFEKAKLSELGKEIDGSMGLIFSSLNPFQLNSLLEENKTYAAAKPGMIAPYDIVVPAGDTNIKAGPILGELQKVGIKAQIKGGKIVVTEDSLVVKKGEKISEELAGVLPRVNILPREIFLNLKAAYENSILYREDVLKINKKLILSQIKEAFKKAQNFAFNLKFFTSVTIKAFIQNAYSKALNLSLNVEILNKETLPFLISKANFQASSLSSRITFPSPPEPKVEEVKKEEKKSEELKEPKPKEKKEEKPEREEKPTEKEPKQEKKEEIKESEAEIKKKAEKPTKKEEKEKPKKKSEKIEEKPKIKEELKKPEEESKKEVEKPKEFELKKSEEEKKHEAKPKEAKQTEEKKK